MSDLPRYSRKTIEENTADYYRHAAGTRPDLRVVDMDGRKIIVKDFRGSDFLFRVVVGPILIRREFGALRNLMGVQGIPLLVGKLDRYALAMEHVAGTSLEKIGQGELDSAFYTHLREVIDEMHAHGVAHCDLRSRGNVMLGEDGRPYVVDFAACVYRGRGYNLFIKWLFGQFVLADRRAVLLIKRRMSPELLTDEDKAELAIDLPFERPAKLIGETVRNLTRKLLTRRSP